MKTEAYFTVELTAIHLRRSHSWVYRQIRKGAIAAARVGNGWRIPWSEITRLLRPANAAAVEEYKRRLIYGFEAADDSATAKPPAPKPAPPAEPGQQSHEEPPRGIGGETPCL